jgi:hypothetical protein
MIFWVSFRLFYTADIHMIELVAIFVLVMLTSKFFRQSLILPALRKSKSIYAHGVIGLLFGSVLYPFLTSNMDSVVREYKWKFIVILIPVFLIALLYNVMTGKFFDLLSHLLGTSLCDSLKSKTFDAISHMLSAIVNTVLILAGIILSAILFSAISERGIDFYKLLPPFFILYCCLVMSDIIMRIIEGKPDNNQAQCEEMKL